MSFTGVIIEESLKDESVLQDVKIISTDVEKVTERHKTPWLTQWTLHNVIVADEDAEEVAKKLSKSLDKHYWYVDYKNDRMHYIIFPHKIFKIDRSSKEEYQAATEFGLSLNIPNYQLDFAPNVVEWKR